MKKTFAVFLICITFSLSIYITTQKTLDKGGNIIYTNRELQNQYQKFKFRLEDTIKKSSLKEAYSLFTNTYENSADKRIYHNISHWLGNEIYNKLGIEGGTLCDKTAGYGCFHGFIETAYSNNVKIEEITSLCSKISTTPSGKIECIHGIGHGFLNLYGHKKEGVEEAMGKCHENFDLLEEEVCIGGIFMEYNLRTMENINKNGFSIRPMSKANEYSPCPSLKKEYQKDCYREVPYWWFSQTERAETLTERCENIDNIENKESCFTGIGRFAPWASNNSIHKIIKICSITTNTHLINLCLENASYRLAYEGDKNYETICMSIETIEKNSCLHKVNEFKCKNLEICEP